MELRSLSASSALTFEQCPARFKVERIDRAPQPSGSPAAFGTACHTALQNFVEGGHHLNPPSRSVMEALWVTAYEEQFTTLERFDEGLDLVIRWMERTDWTGHEVLSTEVKEEFDIPTTKGIVPFRFIWDRCDRLVDDDEIEVVDYKSWYAPVRPGDMKSKIQVRAYGLAAAIKYRGTKRIWITLDQLRYEPVSCSFNRDENMETWKYLLRLAERMIASDGTEEHLNADCRYCVRKHACEQFLAHAFVGGPLALTDPYAAAGRRYELQSAQKAIDVMLGDLDAVILGHCKAEDVFEYDAGPVKVSMGAKSQRVIDPGAAARVLGPTIMAEYPGGIKIGVIDKLLKEKPCRLTGGQVSAIKQLIKREYGDATVKVTASDPTAVLV